MKVRRGVLYLADLEPRRGTEPGKLRPVLVIQTDLLNELAHPSTWIIPCTTRLVGDNLLRVVLPPKIAKNSKECEVMIDQSRSIDNRRFKKELGRVPLPLMREVENKLRTLADL